LHQSRNKRGDYQYLPHVVVSVKYPVIAVTVIAGS
jgi:hypothetical protein